MHIRGGSAQWQSRRNPSLGPPVRRAHPASGATWNVQVVRGKITSRCLWHACRALAIGVVLMLLGAGMATIGYYANHLSIGQEIRGNATVRVKNESRGFHLNNLSYVGPIVMGVGGFIVVAACVMTFEARDSAAKVVPARFKLSTVRSNNSNSKTRGMSGSRRNTGSQSSQSRWEQHLGVFRTSPACEVLPPDRQALTAALVHFSRVLGSPRKSPKSHRFTRNLSRSGSVPNLALEHRPGHCSIGINTELGSPNNKRCHNHHHHKNTRNSSISYKSTRGSTDSRLLHPGMLQFHRQALSVDETGPYYRHPNESFHGSKGSMAVEVHGILPGSAYIINDVVTRNRDRSKRSDTAKRHVLSRQKPVEKEEPHSPRSGYHGGRRRSSTASDVSLGSRRGKRRASSISRTPSMDSRTVQGANSTSIVDINNVHSPERYISSPRSPRRNVITQQSTPSVEREFRSQLSVCSEPTTLQALSCQSSIDPCVPEESPEQEEKELITEYKIQKNNFIESGSKSDDNTKTNRPDTLNLVSGPNLIRGSKKYLYRSNSTKSFKKPSKSKLKLNNEFDQIYFLGNNKTDDDNYNSIEVIDERRRKNFTRLSEDQAKIQRSETVIYNNNLDNIVQDEQKIVENEKINMEKCENKINEIEEEIGIVDESLVENNENKEN